MGGNRAQMPNSLALVRFLLVCGIVTKGSQKNLGFAGNILALVDLVILFILKTRGLIQACMQKVKL